MIDLTQLRDEARAEAEGSRGHRESPRREVNARTKITAFLVRRIDTFAVVKQIPVVPPAEPDSRRLERVEAGLLRQINADVYFVQRSTARGSGFLCATCVLPVCGCLELGEGPEVSR